MTKEERDRKYEVESTPGPIVRQGLEELYTRLRNKTDLRILDLCAGSGVFGQYARLVFPRISELVAVEIREEERTNLERWYDTVHIGDVSDIGGTVGPDFDVVIGNPAFTVWNNALGAGHACAPIVLFLGLNELGTRGSASREVWTASLPSEQWRIGGTLGFRGPGLNPKTKKRWGTDTRSYSWWLWQDGWHERPGRWSAMDLPCLPARDRRWKVRPGTEGD